MAIADNTLVSDMGTEYHGFTYPTILDHAWVHWLWRRLFCPKGWHLWDEARGLNDDTLYCDACGWNIVIAQVFHDDWLDTDDGRAYIERTI